MKARLSSYQYLQQKEAQDPFVPIKCVITQLLSCEFSVHTFFLKKKFNQPNNLFKWSTQLLELNWNHILSQHTHSWHPHTSTPAKITFEKLVASSNHRLSFPLPRDQYLSALKPPGQEEQEVVVTAGARPGTHASVAQPAVDNSVSMHSLKQLPAPQQVGDFWKEIFNQFSRQRLFSSSLF
jgi:hypothetical protein